jgi:hypothetical protein
VPYVRGEALLYRLFDVGYEIRLDQAFDLLGSSAPERPKPVRGEAKAIQIHNPPVSVQLGRESVTIGDTQESFEVTARIFDFGVISLRANLPAAERISWGEFVDFGIAAGTSGAWALFDFCRNRLLDRIRPAIDRPELSTVSEEYIIYRLYRVEDDSGNAVSPEALHDDEIARLLVGERRPLVETARREVVSNRYSYFLDDLAVVSWNAALVVEPVREDRDVQYVLEFANAQLLELRYYDAILDRAMPRINDEIEAERGRFRFPRKYSGLLSGLQTRVADATEAAERVENSFKVTEDVYLAHVYESAMNIFRASTWRRGIDRKVAILRDTYTMLNGESQARRSEVLEWIVIVLIVLEIILALVQH